MRVLQILIASTLLCASIPSVAEDSNTAIEFGKRLRSGGSEQAISLFAMKILEDGMGWANAQLNNRGDMPIYCPPRSVSLQDTQLRDIFERYLAKYSFLGDSPWQLVLQRALMDAFPCSDASAS